MITVITTNENAVEYNANIYSGMSLAEACNQLQVDTLNAIHEFQMNLLLAEHAYLYENGYEISYVNEEGELNDKGKSVKERFIAMITEIGNNIQRGFNTVIEFIMRRIEDVSNFFATKGITKTVAQKSVDFYCSKVGSNGFEPAKVSQHTVNYDAFEKDYRSFYSSTSTLPDTKVYDKYVEKEAKEISIDADLAKWANYAVYLKKDVITNIKNQKNEANKQIQTIIKDLRSKKDIDNSIDQLKEAAKANSDICRESIKVYHTYISNQIGILRAVVLHPEVKKQIHADAKDSFKSKFNKKNNTSTSATDTNVGSKAGVDEIGESTIYNGKFFRV